MSVWPAPALLHPAQRRFLAEDLMRLRRSDEQRRYAAPQRAAKIDANPHQIEAVIFALSRIREGGCILADEVGLGKTIEAGLVIAQLLAEGARRVLLLAPKALLGQWQQELYQLFGIEASEGNPRQGPLRGEGVFLVGREAAGSELGAEALHASERFDLCVVDEAHEVFSGLYKRFNKYGDYREDAKEARTAGRVRELLVAHQTPVLLLTATPIQNTLTELWGLVQYVDPLGTLLGDLPTFRELFCGDNDRVLISGQEEELRDRLRLILKRTLRKQAQEFLEKPFVERQAKLFEYSMSPEEYALYEDVTAYLLEPGIVAFQGGQRQLLLLGFHRRMASSSRALSASLATVARRLRRILSGLVVEDDADAEVVAKDLEDDREQLEREDRSEETTHASPEAVRAELQRIEGFIRRSEQLGAEDSKFQALLQAVAFVERRGLGGQGAGKLVVFTESRVTQDYLRERLIQTRLLADHDITLFRGENDSPRAHEALERWRKEVPMDGAPPSPEMAVRMALVHEFKTRSRVFISTEAGAKGLNLQFCDTLVNYDLPWNPQRIEQRIGRCHRYGQKHGVTVINFIARDNEAQQLTFEILSQKLELFGTVLSATDEVLHQRQDAGDGLLVSSLGADFEQELCRIYDRSRTQDEVAAELRALRDKMDESRKRFEETRARTDGLIEEHLDSRLRAIFRDRKLSLPSALADLDQDLAVACESYLAALGVHYRRSSGDDQAELLVVAPSARLPGILAQGVTAAVGQSAEHDSLHLGHPLVRAAVEHARSVSIYPAARVVFAAGAPAELHAYRGAPAHLRLIKVAVDGFERMEQLVPVIVTPGGEVLDLKLARAVLDAEFQPIEGVAPAAMSEDDVQDGADLLLFQLQSELDQMEQARFERASQQAERYIADRVLVLKRRKRILADDLAGLMARQESAMGASARSDVERDILKVQTELEEVEAATARLEQRDDATFSAFHEHIQQRRYAPPQVTTLLDMGLVLG